MNPEIWLLLLEFRFDGKTYYKEFEGATFYVRLLPEHLQVSTVHSGGGSNSTYSLIGNESVYALLRILARKDVLPMYTKQQMAVVLKMKTGYTYKVTEEEYKLWREIQDNNLTDECMAQIIKTIESL